MLHVLYLIFNEGYAAQRRRRRCSAPISSSEAIRLTRAVHAAAARAIREVAGLLALMLLTDAGAPPVPDPTAS